MHMLSVTKEPIQLVPLETEVVTDVVTRAVAVRAAVDPEHDPINAASLVVRASRTFFEIGLREGKAALPESPPGPPPVVFRESDTGLLHVVYREIVIRFRHGTPEKKRRSILKKHGFKVREVNPFVEDQMIVYDPHRQHSGEQLLEVSNDWAEMEEVTFAAPNFVSQFRRQLPPSIRAEEWHLRNAGTGGATAGEDVNILEAWKATKGKRSVVIAVLDDGVDIDHPNLRSRIFRNPDQQAQDKFGRDFFLPDDNADHFNPRPKLFRDPFDQMPGNDIHGTCCAGVVAAAGRNNGSVGAASGCRILAVKVFHADELASTARVADAIRYAAAKADILSCSWTGPTHPNIQEALADAGQIGRQGKGSAIFCAAGNGFGRPVGFPARDPNTIAVGASTDQAMRASYSNVGPEIAFVAPSSGGVRGIFTTDVLILNRGFNLGRDDQGGADGLHTNSFGGTSSATPLAAGVGALVLSVNPALSRSDLRDILAKTADKIGSGYDSNGHSNEFGFGRINAGRAVQEAIGMAKAAQTAGATGTVKKVAAQKAAKKATGRSLKKRA